VGYSRRQMHRILAELYSDLGVECRSQALVVAARRGYVTERDIGTVDRRTHPSAPRAEVVNVTAGVDAG
jgi:hypothetical protein